MYYLNVLLKLMYYTRYREGITGRIHFLQLSLVVPRQMCLRWCATKWRAMQARCRTRGWLSRLRKVAELKSWVAQLKTHEISSVSAKFGRTGVTATGYWATTPLGSKLDTHPCCIVLVC